MKIFPFFRENCGNWVPIEPNPPHPPTPQQKKKKTHLDNDHFSVLVSLFFVFLLLWLFWVQEDIVCCGVHGPTWGLGAANWAIAEWPIAQWRVFCYSSPRHGKMVNSRGENCRAHRLHSAQPTLWRAPKCSCWLCSANRCAMLPLSGEAIYLFQYLHLQCYYCIVTIVIFHSH